jgi:centromere protein S
MSQDEALMERLKASLWFSIGKIVDEETTRLNTTATPQFIGAMTEMVWAQIGISPLFLHPLITLLLSSQCLANANGKENVAQDLESFSRHAGRTTVTTDDVLLITRRNEALQTIMTDFIDKEKAGKEREKGAKGKGAAAKGRGR